MASTISKEATDTMENQDSDNETRTGRRGWRFLWLCDMRRAVVNSNVVLLGYGLYTLAMSIHWHWSYMQDSWYLGFLAWQPVFIALAALSIAGAARYKKYWVVPLPLYVLYLALSMWWYECVALFGYVSTLHILIKTVQVLVIVGLLCVPNGFLFHHMHTGILTKEMYPLSSPTLEEPKPSRPHKSTILAWNNQPTMTSRTRNLRPTNERLSAGSLQQKSIRRSLVMLLPFLSAISSLCPTSAFSIPGSHAYCRPLPLWSVPPRYGPPSSSDNNQNTSHSKKKNNLSESRTPQQKKALFTNLIHQVQAVSNPQHLPGLLTKHLPTILELIHPDNIPILESILQENDGDDDAPNNTPHKMSETVDLIVSFAEDFVQSTRHLQDVNQKLLGKILRCLSSDVLPDRERALDDLLHNERDAFLTGGFLRHLESECQRLTTCSQSHSPASIRTLQLLRMIQARVVEELGMDLGEAAQVLGSLIGYQTESERTAVLEAGLTVRGVTFAQELRHLTQEALTGFGTVPDADPQLVQIVKQIDARLQAYIEEAELQ